MKKSILCSIVALACGLGLSACGGNDDGRLQLYGRVGGVSIVGLTISNNGGPAIVVEPGSTFSFPDLLPVDSDYDIKVVTEPANVEPNSCVVNNGKGNTGSFSPQNISIVCTIKTYDLGGRVIGLLSGKKLVINNGAQSVTVEGTASKEDDEQVFTMTTPITPTNTNPKLGQVAAGVPYGLTILTQPVALPCTFAVPDAIKGIGSANGLMPAAPVDNIRITCKP